MKNKILIIAVLLIGFVGSSFGQIVVGENNDDGIIVQKINTKNKDSWKESNPNLSTISASDNKKGLFNDVLCIEFENVEYSDKHYTFKIVKAGTKSQWNLELSRDTDDFKIEVNSVAFHQSKDFTLISDEIKIQITALNKSIGKHVVFLDFKKGDKSRRIRVTANVTKVEPVTGIIEFKKGGAELTNNTTIDFSGENSIAFTLPIKYSGETE